MVMRDSKYIIKLVEVCKSYHEHHNYKKSVTSTRGKKERNNNNNVSNVIPQV